MRKLMILIVTLSFVILPASAMEFTAPSAPEDVQPYMPDETESFAQGIWYIIKSAVKIIRPELAEASRICLSLVAIVLLISVMNIYSNAYSKYIRLVGAVVIGVLLLTPANTLIQLGANTVTQVSEYSRLLLPVMTAAVAAQGGTATSAALYSGTVLFDTLLSSLIARLIVPALYIYLCLSVAGCAVGQEMLIKIRNLIKTTITWVLKCILYIFTGYISITGVISGVVDASAVKVAKLTISGMVPVIGGILSDASETILVSAGIMKSSAGIYGIFAILALCVNPFIKIGIQYLLLKLTSGICNIFGSKEVVGLMQDFSTGMGLVLAMTGTICMLILISLVCFLKGMS